MKAVRVSRGRRGSSVQARSAIVGVASRWAAISAAGSSRQEARGGFRRGAGAATSASAKQRTLKLRRCSGLGPSFATATLCSCRPVAFMTLEAVAWVALAQASHEAIAGHLGHDRGGRNGRAGRVSADDRLVHGRFGAEREVAVHESKLRPLPKGAERPLEAGQVGGLEPDPVDLARGDGDERDRLGVGEDGLREPLALGGRKALRVVHFLEEIPPAPEAIRSRSKRTPAAMIGPAQQARPHLVDAGDQANATSEVVGKEGRVAH